MAQTINHQDQKGTVREFTVHDSPPQNGVAEHGMRMRAEQAQALLIASGLPRLLWEEAMKHSTWLQNRVTASALDGKTPYEAVNGKKSHLGGIQEFGAAAYVKDLKAGKLDAHAQLGCFVGYDSESKGYRIYWLGKRSVTVEQNIVFNENDIRTGGGTVLISSNIQSEGERKSEKVIQYPENLEKAETKSNIANQPEKEPSDETQDPNTSSTIPFPSVDDPTNAEKESTCKDDPQQYGRGQHPRKQKGAYRELNEGLTAAIAHVDDLPNDDESIPDNSHEDINYLYNDIMLIGSHYSDPKTLDEALRGPDSKHWEKAA